MALDAVNGCGCRADPDKDGCYRCVYQYRLGRKMDLVSRGLAARVLTDLVGALDTLEKVPTISDIFINPRFDSALESRFIESCPGSAAPWPPGKTGRRSCPASQHLLEVGSERYWAEPQRDLGDNDRVAVACRPDFVLWPANSRSARRPTSCSATADAYQHSLREDARKRKAVVASRDSVYRVTRDVKTALAGDASTISNHH